MTATATGRSSGQAPGPAAMLDALARLRPDLRAAAAQALPGARAAVLGRLWGALAREPVPGLAYRRRTGDRLVIGLVDGRELAGAAAAAEAFAPVAAGLTVELAGRWYDDPAALLTALRLPGAVTRLAVELDNSVANLALARAAPDPDGGTGDPVAWEQAIVDGHPLHPCCRTRIGMSTEDVLAYAPEHRPVVGLRSVEVPAARWLSTGHGLPPVLPMHPWQARHLLDRWPWLRPTGAVRPARPLMSLRTLAPLDDPSHHLKTAVDVQMTSAVRTVSPAALHNGPVASALLSTLAARVGGLEVMPEPAAGAVLVDGEPCRGLAVVVRRVPALDAGEVALPLATLGAGAPPLVARVVAACGDPVAYFGALVDVLLPPVLAMLHLGVGLEAHGQNTLLVLRDGRPHRLCYRDVGGIRVHAGRLRANGIEPPTLAGDLPTDDPGALRAKVLASAVSTVLAEQVALLGRVYGQPPGPLWELAAARARALYDGLPSCAAGDRRAVLAEPLPIKAMTAMRLAADPVADIWADTPNPMAR